MNRASRNKDESKIEFYGAFAAALSFTLHTGNKKNTELASKEEDLIVYRGFQVSSAEIEEKYKVGKSINLTGFTSTTLKRGTAIGFATVGLMKEKQK